MALDRGTLARIDRRVFTELDHSDGVQVVKVPVSDAVWSSWRRYCDVLDITMGHAVAGLISHELATVVNEAPRSVFDLQRASQERANRLEARERELDDKAAQLRRVEDLMREREARLQRSSTAVSGARTAVQWEGTSRVLAARVSNTSVAMRYRCLAVLEATVRGLREYPEMPDSARVILRASSLANARYACMMWRSTTSRELHGSRNSGVVCGSVATLFLFVNGPQIFQQAIAVLSDDGLPETLAASLLVAYVVGFAWNSERPRRWTAVAVWLGGWLAGFIPLFIFNYLTRPALT